MRPGQGVAFDEGPPEHRDAAPTGNRRGAILRKDENQKLGASTFDKYGRLPAQSTGRTTGERKDVHRLVRLWPKQLHRLKQRRYDDGPIPDDDFGRPFAAVMIELLLQSPAGHREANAFIEQSCPWMTPTEHADIFARKRTFWTPAAVGNAIGLTWAEHDDCCPAIRPAGATDAEMAAIRTMKNTAAKRETRKQEAPKPKKEPLPSLRAKVIADMLRPGERRTVKDLCKAVKKRGRFAHLKGVDRLKAAVHDAVNFGIAHGMLLKQIEPGPVAWIMKIGGDKPGHSAGCGQENPTVGKTCPQVRVLIKESGLPVGEPITEPPVEDEDWFTGEWDGSSPDSGRVAQAPPSAVTVINHRGQP